MEGRQKADAPLLHWSMWDAMFKAQTALEGVISNFPNRFIGFVIRRLTFPLGRPYVAPADSLGHQVAKLLLEPSATRDRLTAGMYMGQPGDEGVNLIERALVATLASEPIEAKIKAAAKARRFEAKLPPGAGVELLVARAQGAGVVTAAEGEAVLAARDLTARVIRVDDFASDLGASDLAPIANATPPTTVASRYSHKEAA
jgi:acyl-CoA dehydrogenase